PFGPRRAWPTPYSNRRCGRSRGAPAPRRCGAGASHRKVTRRTTGEGPEARPWRRPPAASAEWEDLGYGSLGWLLRRLGGPPIPGVRVLGIRRLDGGSVRGGVLSRHLKAKNERRPAPFLAFHANRSLVGLHDAERHRQAEPCPLARRLGCEEGLKDAGLDGPWDAGSVILDGELDEAVILDRRLDLDRSVAAGLHGLLRVENEIHQNLLDLVGAAVDERQVRRNRGFERDVVQAQLVMEDRLGVRDHLLERDRFGLQVLLPRELQQIVDDRAAPFRFLLENRERFEERIVGGEGARCELDHALNSGERVLD